MIGAFTAILAGAAAKLGISGNQYPVPISRGDQSRSQCREPGGQFGQQLWVSAQLIGMGVESAVRQLDEGTGNA